jgi:flavodoxin
MRVLIVYESMFGNTRAIAEAIASGINGDAAVSVVGVNDMDARTLEGVDLVVVGAPTHAHGMSRPSTRKSAADIASKPDSNVKLELYALGKGVREWLDSIGPVRARAATFDTRMKGPAWATGSAAKGIAKRLRRLGSQLVTQPTSFFVAKGNTLRPGETERAAEWGQQLAREMQGMVEHRAHW